MPINLPYIVSGTITLSDASNPSGIKIIARNDTTIENINVTTDSNGQYVLDIGNLTSGYQIGQSITIIVNSGLESGESSFTISASESNQTVNITTSEIVDSSDVTYASIQDVYDELDGKTSTDISAERVRNNILRAEAEIDKKTGTSFKSNTITDEIYDISLETLYVSHNINSQGGLARADNFILGGTRVKLTHRPILAISALSKNSGGATSADSWELLSQQSGSGGDFALYKKKGVVEWLQNTPNLQRRSFRTTYTWGLDRTATDRETIMTIELVKELCVLSAIRQILFSKGSASQFSSIDNISLESISISKGIGDSVTYTKEINERIEGLYMKLGVLTSFDIGQEGADY